MSIMLQDEHTAIYETAPAVFVAGLISHQYFRKYEPTISSFFGTIGILQLGLIVAVRVRHSLPIQSFLKLIAVSDAIYVLTLGTSILVYRLFLHPLSSYPGPLRARISKIEWFFRIREGHQYKYLVDLHKQYGDVVRIGPNDLSFLNPQDAALVNGPYSKLQKGSMADGSPWAKARSVTFVRDRTEHKFRRRIWDQGFTTTALKNYETRIIGLVDVLSEQFSKRSSQELDFATWAMFFAFDVMGDLGFGSDFGMVSTGKEHFYSMVAHKAFQMRRSWSAIPWCKYMVYYLPMDKDMKILVGKFVKFGNDMFDARKEKGTTRPDVFSHLLAQDVESGGKLTEDELREDCKAVILAGSDTTGFALTTLLFLLMEHPKKYQLLQEEVDALNKDGQALGTQLGPEQAPFINGVINEALRLFPPAPDVSQRTYGDQPIVINGKYVPPGTSCYVVPYAMKHDERNFSQPESFIPERWIESRRPEKFNHVPKAFVPFGSGLYNCAGKPLALLEMRQFVVTILYRFSFSPGPSYSQSKFLSSLKSSSVMECGGLPVVVAERRLGEK